MANLKEVRNRIGSIRSTQQITKAMKMVAAAKLRRAQDNITKLRPYASKLQEILSNVSSSDSEGGSVYAQEREVNNVLLVVISSDRGLCGGFNSNIIKSVIHLTNKNFAGKNVELLSIGKKASEYFQRRNFSINTSFIGVFSELNFENVKRVAEFVMNAFIEKKYDKVVIVYNEFKNAATQIVRNEQFLPIVQVESENKTTETDYIFEPNKEYIVEELIPKSLKIQMYKAVLDSNASEQGARMTAMDAATENAGELLKELKLIYNRSRQAAITKEILEIVGGAEALSGGK